MIAVGLMEADTVTIGKTDASGNVVERLTLAAADVDSVMTIQPLEGGALEVDGVTIGVGFHWEQRESQRFAGSLRLLRTPGGLTVINDVDLESYLKSVISSEMSADAPDELLKAHAITSRSWLLAQLEKSHRRETRHEEGDEVTVWYDRDNHTLFDVCADDHCQRYQGISRVSNDRVERAVACTRGMVLQHEGKVCDARFSKCCGGRTELFESCWEPVEHAYLPSIVDSDVDSIACALDAEEGVKQWVESRPDAWCANPPREVLASLLNSYDRATTDYFRWQVTYTADSLGRLIERRSGRKVGNVKSLTPLHRGPSGRITRLEIVGDSGRYIVGKELEIRRTLSPSHLYSSAFVVDIDGNGPGATVTLSGAGWGHGVGLCQIGAAVMATQGRGHLEILNHYFPNTEINTIYQ